VDLTTTANGLGLKPLKNFGTKKMITFKNRLS